MTLKSIQLNKFIEEVIKAQNIEENKIIEDILLNFAKPAIKGKITAGKLKWRGLKLIYQNKDMNTIKWIEQRGVMIGNPWKIIFTHKTHNL